jgi:hypothetical protein
MFARPKALSLRFGALAVTASFLLACSFSVPRLNPKPNIALVARPSSLAIAFSPAVEDHFSDAVGNYTMNVQSWHASLEAGFHNGFQKAFPAKPGPSPDWTLVIDKARLEIGDFDHSEARIQYAVTLTGRDGTVRRASGVASRPAPLSGGYTSDILDEDIAEAIAVMYEQIAKELFPETPALSHCVPGQSSACAGPKGCQGFQVCASDGSRFEPCACGS